MLSALRFYSKWCGLALILVAQDGLLGTIGVAMPLYSILVGFGIMGWRMRGANPSPTCWYLEIGFVITVITAVGMSQTVHTTPELIGLVEMVKTTVNWGVVVVLPFYLIRWNRSRPALRATTS